MSHKEYWIKAEFIINAWQQISKTEHGKCLIWILPCFSGSMKNKLPKLYACIYPICFSESFEIKPLLHDLQNLNKKVNTEVKRVVVLLYTCLGFRFWPRDHLPWLSFCSHLLSLQANSGTLPQIRPWPLTSTPFPIYYSLIIILLLNTT